MRRLIERLAGRRQGEGGAGRPTPVQIVVLLAFAGVAVIIGVVALSFSGLLGPPPSRDMAAAERLRALAPHRIAGLDRVSTEVDASTTAGVRAVILEAAYRKGDKRLRLTIVQSPAIEQVIGFGGPDTDEYDRPQPDGYSRRRKEGEIIIVEQWSAGRRSGAYGRLLPGHVYVLASGEGVAERDLRDAVGAINANSLQSLPLES